MNSSENQVVETIETQPTQQVVRKTTTQSDPTAKGDPAQKVYEKKKTILRLNQIIWYILGLIEVLLIFRVALKMLGANASIGFTSFIYALTAPLAAPFRGILGETMTGTSLLEWSTIIAAIVYVCIAWGLVYLLDLIYPISPNDVETT